ncbi:MAG: L-aspartate oxidase, partial [Chloroflexota bacterium]|nr:L-aspartate oxidase [Chloroflexota bacterium]
MSLQDRAAGYDLIVVGSGIAGLYSALLAAPHMRVLLITKGALEESNTRYAQGGIAVALGADDSPELHRSDTLAAGDGLCDPAAVALLAGDGPDCILDLLARGVPFDRDDGELAWTLEAAHSRPRVLHAGGDATGRSIEQTLTAAVREAGVTVAEWTQCSALLTTGGQVTAVSVRLPDGSEQVVKARNVLLATGGAGQLYARTTNPTVTTGDGLALAYRAGAQLLDLEFMQFHPTALALAGAPSFLISEAVRGEGGILRDQYGAAFMHRYHSARELAPRDVVARAIHRQMEETDGEVTLDVTHLDAELLSRRFPTILAMCRAHGLYPLREQIPVAPAAHYLMGGIRTDLWGRTSIPGLLACGEVACTGVHGANRLASNSLLEGLVFGRRVVQGILSGASPALEDAAVDWRAGTQTVQEPNGLRRADLAQLMWRHVGLIRSAGSLDTASAALSSPSSGAEIPSPEERNLALLAVLTVAAAQQRTESRGAHFRLDFPHRDPVWEG